MIFVEGSFVNRMDFCGDDECLDYVEFLSRHDEEYLKVLNAPKVKNYSLFSFSAPIVFLSKFIG